jgi:hypothetical protein
VASAATGSGGWSGSEARNAKREALAGPPRSRESGASAARTARPDGENPAIVRYRPRRLHKKRTKYKPGITTSSHGKIYATAVIA